MTGVEHYAAAETLVAAANDRHADADSEGAAMMLQLAQVHATLAAAAEPEPVFALAEGGPPWTLEDVTAMATELRELRAAVRPALGYLDQTPGGRAVAVELRKLVR